MQTEPKRTSEKVTKRKMQEFCNLLKKKLDKKVKFTEYFMTLHLPVWTGAWFESINVPVVNNNLKKKFL